MQFFFFDTSALVKKYHSELGSDKINKIFKDSFNIFLIANITISEITSAFVKKLNLGEITEEKLANFLSKFAQDILSDFLIVDIERNHINISQDLIVKYNLRTLDSIQLAVLLNLKPLNPVFVCSDVNLINSAKNEKVAVLNPED